MDDGCRFGDYRLDEKLPNTGSMGIVYRATHLPSGRKCAIKVMRDEFVGNHVYRSRFTREREILEALAGKPNVLPIYEGGEIDGKPYVATRYVRGGDLARFIRKGIDVDDAISILRQTAGGLDAAHREQFVHRDVKPGNILIEPRGDGLEVFVADFGVAWGERFKTSYTVHGAPIGTVGFMAPECETGQSVDRRADVFSLGKCLAMMLGRDGEGRRIGAVIERATAHYAHQRPATTIELYAEAEAALTDLGSKPLISYAPPPGMTRPDTPLEAIAGADRRRPAAAVERALDRLGLPGLAEDASLTRDRTDPECVTAVIETRGVAQLKAREEELRADLADSLGVTTVRLMLLSPGGGPLEKTRRYLMAAVGERTLPRDFDSLRVCMREEQIEISLTPRLRQLCDEGTVAPLMAHLDVKQVKVIPIAAGRRKGSVDEQL